MTTYVIIMYSIGCFLDEAKHFSTHAYVQDSTATASSLNANASCPERKLLLEKSQTGYSVASTPGPTEPGVEAIGIVH